jgi:hypothetical protein
VLRAPVVVHEPVGPRSWATTIIDAALMLGRLHRLDAFRSLADLSGRPRMGHDAPPKGPEALEARLSVRLPGTALAVGHRRLTDDATLPHVGPSAIHLIVPRATSATAFSDRSRCP